ncbi:MAG: chromate resistance protein ChrB domain-containing protein [Burkholderiales bacterium]
MPTTFDALLLSLPTRSSTMRMRAWRTLKNAGCGVLRDGVYVLPSGVPQVAALAELEATVQSAGGFAMTVEVSVATPAQLQRIRKLFDRSREYGALVQKMNTGKTVLRRLGKRKAETMVGRLRRSFEELAAIDFYPNHANVQAKEVLTGLEQELRDLFADGEPRSSKARVRRLDAAKYAGRTWATRKRPWVDRLACAWLIKRFIDKHAKFVWIDHPRNCPKRAIGFDFDGAEFTHTGDRVTYEVLLASFGLAQDSALASIGTAVHFLDIGGIPVPDAKGLETVLKGIRENARSDDEMVREASRIFDLLYSAYAQPQDQ